MLPNIGKVLVAKDEHENLSAELFDAAMDSMMRNPFQRHHYTAPKR